MESFDLRLWPEFAKAGGDSTSPAVINQVAIDSRRIDSKQALFVPLPGQNCDGHQFIMHAINAGANFILAKKEWIADPLLPTHCTILRVEDPLHAMQEIAKVYRQQQKAKVIAIVGSYGKTMVKDLLQVIVGAHKAVAASPESFNSQIGVALSLFTIDQSHEIAFIEAAISKKQEMDRLLDMIQPDSTVITHIGKKHLATLGDLKTAASEMIKAGLHVSKGKWVVLPNHPLLKTYTNKLKGTPYFWDERNMLTPHATALSHEHGAKMPYRIDFPDGTQYHNQATFGFYYFMDLLNISLKAAWLLGVPSDSIRETLSKYTAEPMRTEIWKSPIGTTFINDPYCSDPQSLNRALKQFTQEPTTGRRVFVFGGMRGKQDHAENDYRHVGKMISKANIDLLVLMGEHPYSSLISEVVEGSPKTEVIPSLDYKQTLDILRGWIRQDDIVLIKGEKKEPLDTLTEAFNDSICTNQCLINLAAIEANLVTIRNKLAPKTRIMVMVKALAYGTNDIRIAKFLSSCGIDILGVSYVDEGVALKRAGVSQAIFALSAATYEAAKVVKWDLEIGVSEKGLITALAYEAAKHQKKVKVHLHVDTGMSRFGCRLEETLELAQYILSFPSLSLEGIMTHFASADDPEGDIFTHSQASCFEEIITQLYDANIAIPWSHASNSSAVMRFNFSQFNMVRIGLAVYGLYPSEAAKQAMDLRLSLSLISRIVGINICRAGETISYGRSYKVRREIERIAVLPIGYFDGIHRNYSGKGNVMIRGHQAPMVGKICMDFMMVDVTDISNATIGDPVLIFGEDEHGQYLSPEELASSGDSIVYELITCLGPRIQRIFIYEEAYQRR